MVMSACVETEFVLGPLPCCIEVSLSLGAEFPGRTRCPGSRPARIPDIRAVVIFQATLGAHLLLRSGLCQFSNDTGVVWCLPFSLAGSRTGLGQGPSALPSRSPGAIMLVPLRRHGLSNSFSGWNLLLFSSRLLAVDFGKPPPLWVAGRQKTGLARSILTVLVAPATQNESRCSYQTGTSPVTW